MNSYEFEELVRMNLRSKKVSRRTTITTANVGRIIEIRVPRMEDPSSPVETIGLARPAVEIVEAPRTRTLEP